MSKAITGKIIDNVFQKNAVGPTGVHRLHKEVAIYKHLQKHLHIPELLDYNVRADRAKLSLEYIDGTSLKEWLAFDGSYKIRPKPWRHASSKLAQYVAAEMSLLKQGVLYRDLNLEHIIFSNSQAKIVDLEASIIESSPDVYTLNDIQGTWETMAPEEFSGHATLSSRTATYRVAVIIHLTLYGFLPFKRDPLSRSNSHRLRFKPLLLSRDMSKAERKLFSAALSVKPTHRHKHPENFYKRLKQIYDI